MPGQRDTRLHLGNPKVNATGALCCGKPRGCTSTDDGCRYLRHPYKRAVVLGDETVPCQATGVDPITNEPTQCRLLHGHAPPCSP